MNEKNKSGESIPIMRAFESDGKCYIYGYAAIFNSPDSFKTVMTRKVVQHSLDTQLGKYPAVRFMHEKPFGQIIFDREVNGIRTKVDDVGFLTLIEVYDSCDAEFRMVQQGHWGLSWSMNPRDARVEYRKLADGKAYPHFVEGLIFEISVVDSPSHADAVAYVMQRVFNGSNNVEPIERKRFTSFINPTPNVNFTGPQPLFLQYNQSEAG